MLVVPNAMTKLVIAAINAAITSGVLKKFISASSCCLEQVPAAEPIWFFAMTPRLPVPSTTKNLFKILNAVSPCA